MKTTHLNILLLTLLMAVAMGPVTHAASLLDSVTVDARAGYSLGGTIPTPIPATIRHLNSYKPCASGMLAVTATVPLRQRWSLHTGLRLERYAFSTDAQVKNYDVAVTRGGESLEGVFVGDVKTRCAQTQLTLPVQASLDAGKRWHVRAGLFVSAVLGKSFDGWAHDGHLRVDTPTGAKVLLGSVEGERGDYEFDAHMRSCQWGIDAGTDWRLSSHWGAFAEVTFTLNGVFKSNFHTVPQTMHALYGTVGVIYQIK